MLNKILLAAIALGLWATAATTFIHPGRADGCNCANELSNIYGELLNVESILGAIRNK